MYPLQTHRERRYNVANACTPEELLPLTPAVFHILLAWMDTERHGYAIMTEMISHTGGQVRMGSGTLYGSIKRMIPAELRRAPDLDDERRRYYRLTPFGSSLILYGVSFHTA